MKKRPSGRNPKILLVDDDKRITEVLKAGLEREGFSVVAFNDPVQVLKALKQTSEFDAAIFDMRMPQMSGFELYREFRSEVDGQTPVCFLSAFEIRPSEFETMFPDVKVKAFLQKPIGVKELTACLDELTSGTSVKSTSKRR